MDSTIPPSHPAGKAANGARARYSSVPPPPPSNQHSGGKADPYYGQEAIARLCARFITHLFACPDHPPSSTPQNIQGRLPFFIAYALHRTKLHTSVTFASLILLQRLKARFPTARGSSGHRLFISAFMIASKVICDDTYSNKSWSIVAQGLFNLREINQMEREMCNYLDWELTVDNPILSEFENRIRRDFYASTGPYPNYPLAMVSKRARKAAASTSATPIPEPSATTNAIPMFGQRQSTPAKLQTPPPSTMSSSSSGTPTSPDTPSPSYSNNTSPASSASPPTPPSSDNMNARIHEDGYLGFAITANPSANHPLKTKMFALAAPSLW